MASLESYGQQFMNDVFKNTSVLGESTFFVLILIVISIALLSRKMNTWAKASLPVASIFIMLGGLIANSITASAIMLFCVVMYSMAVLRQPISRGMEVINKQLTVGYDRLQDLRDRQRLGDEDALRLNLGKMHKEVINPFKRRKGNLLTTEENILQELKNIPKQQKVKNFDLESQRVTKEARNKIAGNPLVGIRKLEDRPLRRIVPINKLIPEEEEGKKKRKRYTNRWN